MSSFLENENQMVIDAEMSEIANQLLDEWIESNLDEGALYADWRIADMCSSNYLKRRYNEYWDLKPDDQYYIEFEEDK